jgi:predicted ATP-grasp superfamily ATP-dependent carboligase
MMRPSVLVLPVDNSVGLTVARALGREGVPVTGVSFSANGFGLASRYLTDRRVIAGPPETRIGALLTIVEETSPAFLMAHGEANMAGINARRREFERCTKLLFAPQAVLARAFDKATTLRMAEDLGIPVPHSYQVTCPDDLRRIGEAVRFPVVVKPPRRIEDPELAHLHFTYRIIADRAALLGFLEPYGTAPFYPLIQDYHPGYGIGIETCFHRGEPVAVFQHRRIREYPITGGPSVYRRSEPVHPQLLDWSLRLLKAMEWDGVAMVEFRYDPDTDTAVLMEVNGRFWGSLPLAIHAGVNFPYLLYLANGLGTPVTVDVYKTGVYCRQITSDTKWLWATLWNASDRPGRHGRVAALLEYFASFLQCRRYDLEWADDPWPAVAFWSQRLRRASAIP